MHVHFCYTNKELWVGSLALIIVKLLDSFLPVESCTNKKNNLVCRWKKVACKDVPSEVYSELHGPEKRRM